VSYHWWLKTLGIRIIEIAAEIGDDFKLIQLKDEQPRTVSGWTRGSASLRMASGEALALHYWTTRRSSAQQFNLLSTLNY